jgi:hypothetical protein
MVQTVNSIEFLLKKAVPYVQAFVDIEVVCRIKRLASMRQKFKSILFSINRLLLQSMYSKICCTDGARNSELMPGKGKRLIASNFY